MTVICLIVYNPYIRLHFSEFLSNKIIFDNVLENLIIVHTLQLTLKKKIPILTTAISLSTPLVGFAYLNEYFMNTLKLFCLLNMNLCSKLDVTSSK